MVSRMRRWLSAVDKALERGEPLPMAAERRGHEEHHHGTVQEPDDQKKYLCRFLKKGDVPIDNGYCEWLAKAFAIEKGQLDVLHLSQRS